MSVQVTPSGEPVVVEGLRTSVTIARALNRGALADNIDTSIYVPASAFEDASVLRGKVAVITNGASTFQARIMSTREHAAGAIIVLIFGSYEQVAK